LKKEPTGSGNQYSSDKVMAPYLSVHKQGPKYHESKGVLKLTLIFPRAINVGVMTRWRVKFTSRGRGCPNYCIGGWVASEPV